MTTLPTAPGEDSSARGLREKLAQRIEALGPKNERIRTLTDGLRVYALTEDVEQLHIVYRPAICLVLRGRKRVQTSDRVYAHGPQEYFFTAIPLPVTLDLQRTDDANYVGLTFELDIHDVARVALELDDNANVESRVSPPRSVERPPVFSFVGSQNERLLDALHRLVEVSLDQTRHPVLHKGLADAVIVELLLGVDGSAIRAAANFHGDLRGLFEAIRVMQTQPGEPMTVPWLAQRARMSESTFFAKFRQATGTTPLRYLKTLRLTKARVLLASGRANISEAAREVGYASASQFSRDFRKFFGFPPSNL